MNRWFDPTYPLPLITPTQQINASIIPRLQPPNMTSFLRSSVFSPPSSFSSQISPSSSTFNVNVIQPAIIKIQPPVNLSFPPPHNSYNNTSHMICSSTSSFKSSSSHAVTQLLQKGSLPFALSLLIFWPNPAQAGFLSGSTGIESVPGPQLPSIEFLDRFNEENQKKYAENDNRIKSSPIIKELLERSKQNKDKNKQQILDKYCLRGAEWGVGDCSTQGMTDEEKEKLIAMLKEKVGEK